ncbi:hypothetical protein F5Y14DRAFT_347318 [Nemania sp. NC0429]|nr:hypothetical protein F5Y14DRAFT_347318 [Nemania sp. NC0429]
MEKQTYQQHDSHKNYEHELEKKDNVDSSTPPDPATRLEGANVQAGSFDRDREPHKNDEDSPAAVPEMSTTLGSNSTSAVSEPVDEEAAMVRIPPEIRSSSSDEPDPGRFEREGNPEPQVRTPTLGPRGRPRGRPTSSGSRRSGLRLRSRVGISNHECRILRDGTIIRGKQGATFAGFVPNSRTSPRTAPRPDRPLSQPTPLPPSSSQLSSPPTSLSEIPSRRLSPKQKKAVRFASPLEQDPEPSRGGTEPICLDYNADEEEDDKDDEDENDDEDGEDDGYYEDEEDEDDGYYGDEEECYNHYPSSRSDASIKLPEAPKYVRGPEYTSAMAYDTLNIGAQRPNSSACKRRHPKTGESSPPISGSPAKKSKPNTEQPRAATWDVDKMDMD